MFKKHLSFRAVAIFSAFVFLISCTKDKTPAPPEPCDPTKVYFQRDMQPLFVQSCAKSGCHDAITKTEGLNLSTYEGIMKIVKPYKPNESEVMKVVNETDIKDRMPLAPNPPLTQTQKDMISKWISEGAFNNYCVENTCNADSMSYANHISKIMNTNCIGCHSGSNLSAGYDLSIYTGVKSAASSGKLVNSVSQNGLAVPMPQGSKLSTCDISKIKSWVDAGALNN